MKGFIFNVKNEGFKEVTVRNLHLAIAAELPATESELSLSVFVYNDSLKNIEEEQTTRCEALGDEKIEKIKYVGDMEKSD